MRDQDTVNEPTLSVEDDSNTKEEEDKGDEDHDEKERKTAVKATFASTRFVRYYLYAR